MTIPPGYRRVLKNGRLEHTLRFPFFQKKSAALKFVISKPPLGYCILFWRADNQPPQQRFFISRWAVIFIAYAFYFSL
jgi:hypothetical protein